MTLSWETALQSILVGMSAIGSWFLYDLVKEFKDFKKNTGSDIASLKRERDIFQQIVRGSELSMKARVMELNAALETNKTHVERGLGIIDNELARIRMSIDRANEKAQKFDDFMKLSLKLCNTINERQKKLEGEIRGTVTKL